MELKRFVPYRLAWKKVSETPLTLSLWESDATKLGPDAVRDEDRSVSTTAGSVHDRFLKQEAEWGMFGSVLSVDKRDYFIHDKSGALTILKEMTRTLVEDGGSKDLRDLHVALTKGAGVCEAAFYFLEEDESVGSEFPMTQYSFFAIACEKDRTVVREYRFVQHWVKEGRFSDYFELARDTAESHRSYALDRYRSFFDRQPDASIGRTQFSLKSLGSDLPDDATLLAASNNDALLQLAALHRIEKQIERQGGVLARGMAELRMSVEVSSARERRMLLVLVVAVGILALRSLLG